MYRPVIYQIYPRSFQDSSGSGTGDLNGIRERLPYVAALGVDAIWLSPFFTSPMADMGYDVSDHCNVDPSFGTLDDFDGLVKAAHDLGLKVILDQVLSHTSIEHPLFNRSRQSRDNAAADWFVWADPKPDGTPPNNWQSLFGGSAWEWDIGRRQFYFHNFLVDQPDLNFHNPAVQDWALDVLTFWTDRGVDGFRLDTANFYFHDAALRDNPLDTRDMQRPTLRSYDMQFPEFSKNRPECLTFMTRLRKQADKRGTLLLGEIGESHHPIQRLADYTALDRLHMGYHPEMMGQTFTAAHFREQVEHYFALNPDGCPAWAFSNHDVPRHVSRWARHAAEPAGFAKLCAALLLSLPGAICLYQGEELGLPVPPLTYDELVDPEGLRFWPENPGRDGARTPMPWKSGAPHGGFSDAAQTWLPVKPAHLTLAVDTQNDPGSVLSHYRRMIAMRTANPALSRGPVAFLETPESVLAFTGAGVVRVFNLSPDPVTLPVKIAGSFLSAQHADVNGTNLHLGPNGFIIAHQTAD